MIRGSLSATGDLSGSIQTTTKMANEYPDKHYFEDFAVGETLNYGEVTVTAAAIKAFAREYDPEPYHLDEELAKDSMLGELIASGVQIAGWWRRMSVDAFPNLRSEISPGWDEIKWKAPARPGDVLSASSEIIEARPLASRPTLGLIRLQHALTDQHGELKMTHISSVFFKRRPPD